ncbi:hypothetical protein CAEBREN_22184 [Caenorhabditis brenneri]|uniref:Uncharacterized protein n=1 Tax=Caenorhabditis brenneri TaxID=135651 RepID=G0PEP1_CAEBE|nr:hypothetical protein CAEBREN_19073 [Caenorhabditis brenneri]EGT53117.1 hypothetical protein CAEBREN_22184 [Caenorhabditis brenneri]
MKDIELHPLVKTDEEILEEHSNAVWTPEYLYSQEFDAVFQKLFNEYRHGEFSRINDHSDFQAFHRMFKSLKEKRNELEDKFFPEKAAQRVEVGESEEEETQGCRECYDKLQKLTKKVDEGDGGFSWKRLLFGCVPRQNKENVEHKTTADLFKY